jgi:hypothetical protein
MYDLDMCFATAFDSHIDETTPAVVMFGITFTASQILKECDPVAYHIMYRDYVNYFCLDEAE